MNSLQVFNDGNIDLKVKEVNGVVYLDAEQAALGLGISFVAKSGNEVVRWERVRKYLNSPEVEKGSFITEAQFYKLAFKANSKAAERFTNWVAEEVLPTIRKHGAYLTPEKIEEVLLNPETIIKLATQIKTEREGRLIAEQRVAELTPKADYTDEILKHTGLIPVSIIAKDYGMSPQAFNQLLHKLGIQYKQGRTWLLYAKYQNRGWTQSTTHPINDGKGVAMHTKWTQKGRWELYQLLKDHDIYPVIERMERERK